MDIIAEDAYAVIREMGQAIAQLRLELTAYRRRIAELEAIAGLEAAVADAAPTPE